MIQSLLDNAKVIGGCVTAVGAMCGGYIAIDGPVPATKHYVITQNEGLKSRVIDNQLQLNTVQRNLLRKEKFDRDIELTRDPASPVRSILQQRLDQIHDELDNIEKEREDLRKEKAQK